MLIIIWRLKCFIPGGLKPAKREGGSRASRAGNIYKRALSRHYEEALETFQAKNAREIELRAILGKNRPERRNRIIEAICQRKVN